MTRCPEDAVSLTQVRLLTLVKSLHLFEYNKGLGSVGLDDLFPLKHL